MFNVLIFVFSKPQLYSVSHNFIQCLAFVFNKAKLYLVLRICNQETKITFKFSASNVHWMKPWNMYWHRIGYFLFSLCHSCVFLFGTDSRLYIHFCVKKFPLCIYHDRERVSSGMTISSFCFLDTQRLILWNIVVMEKVSYSKRCVHLWY